MATADDADRARPAEPENETRQSGVTRRLFLKRSGTVAAIGGAGAISATGIDAQVATDATPTASDWDPVPAPPESIPSGATSFFNPHQAATVEALASRIFPGDESDPGAREAGVLAYIDHLLAISDGFAEPTYRQPPYAMTYTGDSPPDQPDQEYGYEVVWVKEDQLERYGFQSILTPREIFQRGLPALDAFARSRFGQDFVDLSEEQQDEIVGAMADGDAEGFEDPSGVDFFEAVHEHVVQGMFADPLYGGNRDLVGWKLLGYPGAQRAYTPDELKQEGTDRAPQSLADLPHFHAGRETDPPEALQPVRGTDEHDEHRAGDDDS